RSNGSLSRRRVQCSVQQTGRPPSPWLPSPGLPPALCATCSRRQPTRFARGTGLRPLTALCASRFGGYAPGGLVPSAQMTLVLSLITESWAIQVSDRKQVWQRSDGEIVREDDNENKAVLWCNRLAF